MNILEIFDALIDTAERTTDLENVYDDKKSENYSWEEVKAAREELARLQCQ